MLQSEFTKRTGCHVTEELFNLIHEQYMQSTLDKDAFCAKWKRNNLEGATMAMVQEIWGLRESLKEEERKRELEREHAQKELLEALHKANAYAEELIRIYDIKGDDKAMHALFTKLQEKYNH